MADWPLTLPQSMLANVSVTDDESRLTSAMDAGPASIRNRFTAITQTVEGSIILSGSELETFLSFFRETLSHGMSPFNWTHPVTGDEVSMRFKDKPKWECIRPSASTALRLWKGNLVLEIQP